MGLGALSAQLPIGVWAQPQTILLQLEDLEMLTDNILPATHRPPLMTSYPKHIFKFGLLCSYAINITCKMKFRFAKCIRVEVTVTRYIYLSNLAVKQGS